MIRTDATSNRDPQFKPISSLVEFEEKYSVEIDDGIIRVTERTTKYVLAKLTTGKTDRCTDYANPSHFHNGVYYFVLSSQEYTAKYVYSFDPIKKSIRCILAPLDNPHFFKNRLIEFGSGCTAPGDQHYRHSGTGIITVYGLSAQQGKEVKKIFVKDGSCGGWDGSIDEEKEKIRVFDHVTGKREWFPIFDKV